jgi:glycosyltransferase involved in cell wall biosynthesis
MRRTPVTISKSLFSDLGRYTSVRLKNAFIAGAVVAVEKFVDMEGLGLISGYNCLVWSTPNELIELLREWTKSERSGDRMRIRERAHALAIKNFSWDNSVEELLAIVRDYRARRGLA